MFWICHHIVATATTNPLKELIQRKKERADSFSDTNRSINWFYYRFIFFLYSYIQWENNKLNKNNFSIYIFWSNQNNDVKRKKRKKKQKIQTQRIVFIQFVLFMDHNNIYVVHLHSDKVYFSKHSEKYLIKRNCSFYAIIFLCFSIFSVLFLVFLLQVKSKANKIMKTIKRKENSIWLLRK